MAIAIILYIIAAIIGFIILAFILRHKAIPNLVVFSHTGITIVAILLVIFYLIIGKAPALLILGLTLFSIESLGGATLLMIDKAKKNNTKLILSRIYEVLLILGLITMVIYLLQ